MLFTPEYADEQRRIHDEQPAYGSRGYYWAYLAAGIAQLEGCKSVLDYGCGKGTIGASFRQSGLNIVTDYDPAIKGKNSPAAPADLVVCVDVMEHIEPDCLKSVLADLARVSRKILFVAISTIPSKRTMSDGRNTHLIVEDSHWWRTRFESVGFSVRRVWGTGLQEWVCMMNAPVRNR
jgi:2-polyprenyl-3-methyl-5-hydroxy-6-metoxy-1,4-benzoquinol methylase